MTSAAGSSLALSARGDRAGRAAPPARSERGYTLAELLTVIAIMSVLAGLSLGVFATLPGKLSHETAAAAIRALLRRARAAAIESRSDAAVVFAGRKVEARAWSPRLLMRFDDLSPDSPVPPVATAGAKGAQGRISLAVPVPGKVGAALQFDAPGAHVDVGMAPLYECRRGLRLEAWVMPGDLGSLREPAADGTRRATRPPAPGKKLDDSYVFQIAGKGRSYWLAAREDMALTCGVLGPGMRAPLERETAPGALRADQWSEVAMMYDGTDLALFVDGFRVDLAGEKGEKLPPELAGEAKPLVISSPDPGLTFYGAIDEVRLLGIDAEEELEVAEDVVVEGPPAVRFDARGTLDALYHEGPQTISVRRTLRSADTKLAAKDAPGAPILITVERTGALR